MLHGPQYSRLRRLRPPTRPATGPVARKISPDTVRFPTSDSFYQQNGRSKGDDTTEQITYPRQEAETLVERWADTVLRVAYTWTGNPQDAQDVCQTVLLKLLTRPERFPDPNRQRAFVLRVTVNCCKDLKKSAWARRRVSLEAAADAAVTMPESGESPVLEAVLALPENKGKLAFLGRVKDARFKRQVVPGDVVELECRLTRQKGPIGVGECIAKVDGETAVTAELTFAIGAE